MRLGTYASVATAVSLIFAKAWAWWQSDSVSMLATLTDSSLDLLASLVTLFAVYHALQPADKEHRFGHGKAEPLAGLWQALFVSLSALFLLYQAVQRLITPQPLADAVGSSIGVMLFAIVMTGLLLLVQRHVINKTGSTAISADALHYKTDFLINISVIVAIVMTAAGWHRVDALMAIAIAIYIMHSAWQIMRDAINLLMDHELPVGQRQQIQDLVLKHTEVRGLHDLRTRQSGLQIFIQLHLELDGDLSLRQASVICQQVEQDLQTHFSAAEVLIHPHPANGWH
ncbi:MAG: cation diffusion facilitator family transporter [Methylophaga sp.]